MLRSFYQVAQFVILTENQMKDFLTHRKHWWNDRHTMRPGFQTMFCITTICDPVMNTYHEEVKAYRRNINSPLVGEVA